MSDERDPWSTSQNADSNGLTTDENLEQLEKKAEENYAKSREERTKELERLRNEREHSDSRKSWQEDKTRGEVGGQNTNARRVFAKPHDVIFGIGGKSKMFSDSSKRSKAERYLRDNTTVSTKDRKAYLGALECFKNRRDGTLHKDALRRMNGVLRTGNVGTNKETLEAINEMKEKGIIKDKGDLKKILNRGTVRKISSVFMRRNNDHDITPSRFGKADNLRPLSGGGISRSNDSNIRGSSSTRRP
ncbi:MAG: hypothetical protein PHX30_04650 [Candidatus Pacebacteria bacterium]|nr:hypothetical protein [Candidatus Paceibacterota bacterium]